MTIVTLLYRFSPTLTGESNYIPEAQGRAQGFAGRPWERFPSPSHLAKRVISLKIEKGRILCPLEADLGQAKMGS